MNGDFLQFVEIENEKKLNEYTFAGASKHLKRVLGWNFAYFTYTYLTRLFPYVNKFSVHIQTVLKNFVWVHAQFMKITDHSCGSTKMTMNKFCRIKSIQSLKNFQNLKTCSI